MALLANGAVYWEMEVKHQENCTGLQELTVIPTDLMLIHDKYNLYFCFWVRNFVNTFIPFFLLICLNSNILQGHHFSLFSIITRTRFLLPLLTRCRCS